MTDKPDAIEVLRKALTALEYDMTTIGNKKPIQSEWEALDALERLVEASKNYRIVRVAGSASMVKIMHDEWISALADVLGEEV